MGEMDWIPMSSMSRVGCSDGDRWGRGRGGGVAAGSLADPLGALRERRPGPELEIGDLVIRISRATLNLIIKIMVDCLPHSAFNVNH